MIIFFWHSKEMSVVEVVVENVIQLKG